MNALELTLVYLLAAVLGVVACRWLRLPAILGYLLVGVLIEPHTFGLAFGQDADSIKYLAEYGVVFLMFVIGLEFSLPRLRAMRRHVFGLGLAQVALTLLIATLAAAALARWLPERWHLSWQSALALSSAMAMSSTAIVVKLMADRLELESAHGQRVMGVLLLQDLTVVPLVILVSALGSSPEHLAVALLLGALKAGALVVVLLWGGPRAMRWWLTLVARRKSEDLIVLNVLLLTLGLAWLTEQAGLSMGLGAFICGMLISETEFKYQVEAQIRPFHDVLLGLFFITIGMLLDWHLVLQQWPLVLLLTLGPLLFKLVLVTGLARGLGAGSGTALRTGLYLAQAGEFGFVLLTLGRREGLVAPELFNPVLAAMVISMFATPFIIMASGRIVMRLVSGEWLQQSLQMTQIARRSMDASAHVLICGYGRSGQNLARILEREGIAYMALDMDPDLVREAAGAGNPVAYGDASRAQALLAAGIYRARAVVLTYLNPPHVMKTLAAIRQIAPQVPVLVRTQTDRDLEKLRQAGATEIVPEAMEGSLLLASHALALVGVPMRRVRRVVQQQREARYGLLRGHFHGAESDPGEDALQEDRLETLTVSDRLAGRSLGQALGDLLRQDAIRIVGLRRDGVALSAIDGNTVLEGGETLLISGKAGAIAGAQRLLQWREGGTIAHAVSP
ncbi:MAG: cation:proton antiporter [Burkholderiaceae bacterium]|jgi:CPA2 family monovalent cation:H+ antiporter-2|nr:cation:proton antiporter [Burkholderiaceae bacterium]